MFEYRDNQGRRVTIIIYASGSVSMVVSEGPGKDAAMIELPPEEGRRLKDKLNERLG